MFAIPHLSSFLIKILGMFSVSPRTTNLAAANFRLSGRSASGEYRNGGGSDPHHDLECGLVLPRVHASVFDGTQDLPGDSSVVVYKYEELNRRAFQVEGVLVFAASPANAVRVAFPSVYGEIEADVGEVPEFDRYAWDGLAPNDNMRFSMGYQAHCPVCKIGLTQTPNIAASLLPQALLADGHTLKALRAGVSESAPLTVVGAADRICCESCAPADVERSIEARANISAMLSRLETVRQEKEKLDGSMRDIGAASNDRWLVVGGRPFEINAVRPMTNREHEFVIWDKGHEAAIVSNHVMRQLIVAGKAVSRTIANANKVA